LTLLSHIDRAHSLVDVGSGGGFPGAVIAVAKPELAVTCVESIQKKAAFLETLRMQIAPNLRVLCMPAEQLQEQFDAAVSRATWDPAAWLARGSRLVSPGGILIAMQTAAGPVLAAPEGFDAIAPTPYRIAGVERRLHCFRRR